jgi:uncharacterized phage protein (TIGR01671 family)
MREIIFRGRTKGNEWVFGGYVHRDGKHFIFTGETGLFPVDAAHKHLLYKEFILREVESETVGQFTGLLDLKGQKIFEGDIVRWGAGRNVEVIWDGKCARFTGAANDAGHGYCIYRDVEVIGNIHDNPGLMEG